MRMTKLAVFLALPVLVVCAEEFSGKVVGVADGDTISVLRDGKAAKVRLHGIDCPESGQDYGTVAKQFTSKACFGKEVTVEVTDTDRYGRTVGIVYLPGGEVLNHELVAAGLAWWYQQYASDDKTLARLEQSARDSKAGLWSMPGPVPPWDFRRGVRAPETPSAQPSPVSGASAGETVYVTATGKKYHADGCRYLSKSKIPMALDQAAAQGYGPCSVCGPPAAAASAPVAPYLVQPPAHAPPAVQAVPNVPVQDDTVYITRTGEKYHRDGCRYLSRSQIPISQSSAISQGYGACSVCRP